jgi:hypothetical protein
VAAARLGKLAGEHIGPGHRQRRALAGDQRHAIGGVADEGDTAARPGARSTASETSSPMQSWEDCITGMHESSFWKRQDAIVPNGTTDD